MCCDCVSNSKVHKMTNTSILSTLLGSVNFSSYGTFLTLTLLWGWWRRCEKNSPEGGRKGGEKKDAQRARWWAGVRTQDLPHARRGSPAAPCRGYALFVQTHDKLHVYTMDSSCLGIQKIMHPETISSFAADDNSNDDDNNDYHNEQF